jgi:nicotinamidase-related amidase
MDTQQSAIILVGYQNDYFATNGILRGVIEDVNSVDSVLRNTIELLGAALNAGMTVVSTPIILTADYRGLAESVGILGTIKESGAFKAGTIGADSIPELQAFGDQVHYVNGKQGFNAFSNTDLNALLIDKGIKHLYLAGMITSLCIDSTGRAAYERGYRVTIVSDCVSARTPDEQEFYCKNIFPLYADVMESREIIGQIAPAAVV